MAPERPDRQETTARRSQRIATLLLLAGTLAALAAWWYGHSDPFPEALDPGHRSLLVAIGDRRPIEPRLTGFEVYRPCRQPVDNDVAVATCSPMPEPGSRSSRALIAAGREILHAARAEPSPTSLHTLGLWHLVHGEAGTAIETLERAAALGPPDPRLLSDLAAAHRQKAVTIGDPAEDLASLWYSEQALALRPTLATAVFNRALALEALHLTTEAVAAGTDFLSLEPASGWAAEVKYRLAALRARAADTGEVSAARLATLAENGHEPELRELVERDPQAAQESVEDELFPLWAGAFAAGRREEADRRLTMLRRLTEAVTTITGDSELRDGVRAIERASPSERSSLAGAHLQYRRARVLYEAQESAKAAELFRRVARDFEAVGSPFLYRARYYRAVCAYTQGALDQSLGQLATLRPDLARKGYGRLLGYTDWMLGLNHVSQGRFSDGIEAYRSALGSLQKTRTLGAAAFVESLIADALVRLGETHNAWRHTRAALEHAGQNRNQRQVRALYDIAAQLVTSLGYPQVARYYQDRALESARRSNLPNVVAEALYLRSRERYQNDDIAGAREDLLAARRWLDGITDPQTRRAVEAGILISETQVFADSPLEAHRARLTAALAYFEQARHDAFLPELYAARARAFEVGGDLDGAVADLARAIGSAQIQRQAIGEANWRVSFSSVTRQALEAMLRLRLAQDSGTDEILPLTDQLRDAAYFGEGEDTAIDWRALTALPLPERAALISYSVLEDRVVGWLLRRGSLSIRQVPIAREKLETDIVVAADPQRSLAQTAQVRGELFCVLLAPFAADLEKVDSLVIAPDWTLSRLPFGLLVEPTSGRHLLESHTVALTPSAERMLRGLPASVSARRSRRSLLAVGDPAFDLRRLPGLSRLPAAGREARDVAALYERSELLDAKQATKKNLLALLGTTDVLHFAGHGIAAPESPGLSRLVLADDGSGYADDLYAAEIRALDLRSTSTVILGACEAGLSRRHDGAGILSLAGAFLRAGAHTVIASAVVLDDTESRRFFLDLHRELARGAPAALAVKNVQRVRLQLAETEIASPWIAVQVISVDWLDLVGGTKP